MRQMETPSHHGGATPLSKRQEVTATAVTLSLSRKAVQGKVGFVMRPAPQ